MKPSVCQAKHRRCGFTLIEVVASITLMAVLLTGALLAYSSHARQIRKAHQQLEAVKAMDLLMMDWSLRPSAYVGRTDGVCGNDAQFVWHVAPLSAGLHEALGARILRWSIFENDDHSMPLVQLDVVDSVPVSTEPYQQET